MDFIMLHRNDTQPDYLFQLYDRYTEEPIDVSSSDIAVVAKFREKYTDAVLWATLCTKLLPVFGLVQMTLPTDALRDLAAGRYEVELTVCHSSTSGSITAITQASPGVITDVAHGLVDDDDILIYDVAGMIELNAMCYRVVYIGADTFSLLDQDGAAVDTTDLTGYSSGGTWVKLGGPETAAERMKVKVKEDFQ